MKLKYLLGVFFIFILNIPFCYSGENQWSYVGPNLARESSLLFHPQTLNVVFADSFRSTDSGRTWHKIDRIPYLIHPLNPGVMISIGRDVYSSTDLGNTWQFRSNFLVDAFETTIDVEFHPGNSEIFYALVDYRGVDRTFLITTDGGRTWNRKGILRPAGKGAIEFEVDPKNGEVIYALSHVGLIKSTDGGSSWKNINKGLENAKGLETLAIDPLNTKVLYLGGAKEIFKSTNGGNSWFLLNCQCTPFDIAIDNQNSNLIYAVGDVALKSFDAGTTWTPLKVPRKPAPFANFNSSSRIPAPFRHVAVHPKRSNLIFVSTFDQGLFRSQNGGNSWLPSNQNFVNVGFRSFAFSEQQGRIIGVDSLGRVFRTFDSGQKWEFIKSLLGLNLRSVKVHPKNSNLVIANGFSAITVSGDGGKTWTLRTLPDQDSFTEVHFHSQSQDVLYGLDVVEGVWKSNDQARTWQLITHGLNRQRNTITMSVDPQNGEHLLLAASPGRIYKSVNGGQNWTLSSAGLAKDTNILTIQFAPSNPNVVYAGANIRVYKSSDGGSTWTVKSSGLNNRCCDKLAVDPSNSLTVLARGGGLYITEDGGENWSPFDSTGVENLLIPGDLNLSIAPWPPFSLYLADGFFGLHSYTKN